MARYCFLLQVRPELLTEYRERHASVWPEMLTALRDTGWRNYSIFARPDGLLVGYVEADDLGAAQQAMAATEVNARWQAEMAKFFIGLDGRGPDESFVLLEQIFNLDDQAVQIEQQPVQIEEQPMQIKEQPVQIEEQPVQIEEQPVQIEEQPVQIKELPE